MITCFINQSGTNSLSREGIISTASKAISDYFKQQQDIVNSIGAHSKRITVASQYGEVYDGDSLLRKSDADKVAREEEERRKQERAKQREHEKEIKENEKQERKRNKNEEDRRKEEAKKERKSQMEKKALDHSCRMKGCGARWYPATKTAWMWCDGCGCFGLCPSHWKAKDGSGKRYMERHELRCREMHLPNKRRRHI